MKDSSELFWDNKYAGAKTPLADLTCEAENILKKLVIFV